MLRCHRKSTKALPVHTGLAFGSSEKHHVPSGNPWKTMFFLVWTSFCVNQSEKFEVNQIGVDSLMCLKYPRIIRIISESSVNFPKHYVVKLIKGPPSWASGRPRASGLEVSGKTGRTEPSQKVKWISVLIETNWQSTGAMLKASIKIIIAILVILWSYVYIYGNINIVHRHLLL